MWLLKLLIRCLYKLEMCTGMERSAIEKELFFQFLVFFKANPIFQKTNFLVAQTKWGNVAKLLLYCFKTHNCRMQSTLNIYETLKTNLLCKSKEKVLWKQWLVCAKYFVALSVFNLIFLFVGFLNLLKSHFRGNTWVVYRNEHSKYGWNCLLDYQDLCQFDRINKEEKILSNIFLISLHT